MINCMELQWFVYPWWDFLLNHFNKWFSPRAKIWHSEKSLHVYNGKCVRDVNEVTYFCQSYCVWSKSGCKVVCWFCALYLMALYFLGHLSIVFISCCFGVVTPLVLHQLQQSLIMSACGQQQSLKPVMSPMTNIMMRHMTMIPSVLGWYVPGWNMGIFFCL